MKLINDFIKVYDNVLPKDICNSLIDKFDDSIATRRNNRFFDFSEILIQNDDRFNDEFTFAHNAFNEKVKTYADELLLDFFPPIYGYEMFRLKKYQPDGYFNEHIDVGSTATMKRFLSFFCYLNDAGGTTFSRAGIEIESKPGRLLMFPPNWMFPHKAEVRAEKYLLHTYLHYIEPNTK